MKIFLLFISLFTFTLLLLPLDKSEASDFSVGIYPPIIQIDATPPTGLKQDITLKNLSDTTITLQVVFKPFTASPENNGQVQYLSKNDIFGADPNIFDKIQILDGDEPITDITLSPKQQKTLTLRIGLPKDEPPSDYYFSILFTSKDAVNGTKNGTSLIGGIASNVLLSIGPKSKTTGILEEFSAPWFFTRGPIPFTVLLHNISGHFIVPKGEILIKNMFNQLIGKVDLLPVNILEDTRRYIPDSSGVSFTKAYWNEGFLLGLYRANLIISLSPEGPIFRKTIYFFALPLPYIIGIILASVLIVTIILRVRKRLN